MQLGESIGLSDFVSEDVHNKKVCPWHNPNPAGKSKVMDPQTPNEDTDAMPENLGTKLGTNLGNRPEGELWLEYEQGYEYHFEQGEKKKMVQSYSKNNKYQFCYDLQFAPHHLIPGNESLKDSTVVSFLGDENAIQNFGSKSYIKEGKSVNYDVNHADNGVWLPSPYALSNSNQWPSASGIKIIIRDSKSAAKETQDFVRAYVAAGIEETGCQFHMRHVDYSAEVAKVLDEIGSRLKKMVSTYCPIAKNSKDKKKVDPPMGLPVRLNVLSNNLRRLLTGSVWRAPLFTDGLTEEYAEKHLEKTQRKGRVTKVL